METSMDRWSWMVDKQVEVHKAVRECWNRDHLRQRTWDENRITGDVLNAIGTSDSVQWGDGACRASWRMFQAYGDYENLNGDIALRVTLSTAAGDVLTGVKYFEAKVADPVTQAYSAIKAEQLNRMAGTPGHEVLLYSLWWPWEPDWWPRFEVSAAGTLPTPLALALYPEGHESLNANASSFVRVFADALTGRGLDLDAQRVVAFVDELNRVDSRHVDALPSIDVPRKPSFYVQANVAVGQNPEPRPMGEPPQGYRPFNGFGLDERDEPSDRFEP